MQTTDAGPEIRPRHSVHDCIIDSTGKNISVLSCIFPILKAYSKHQMRAIGTGFFISRRGIFVTAGHVLTDWLESDGSIQSRLAGAYFEPHKNNMTIREIEHVFLHEKADIGIGMMKQTEVDGETIAMNYCLPVSFYWPRHDEIVRSVSFPQTLVSCPLPLTKHPYFRPQGVHSGSRDGPVILPSPMESIGRITKGYRTGRDRVFLPSPCYEAELQVYGGSSGGPVFGMGGGIIGVTNTGFDEFPVSHFTPVSEIFDISLTNVVNAVTGKELTVEWLIDSGFIELQADDDYHPMLKSAELVPRTPESHV